MTLEDFQPPPVPDEENAAKFFQDAAAAIVVPAGPIVDIGDLCGDLKLVEQIAPEAKKLIEANQTALNLARQGALEVVRGLEDPRPKSTWYTIHADADGSATARAIALRRRNVLPLRWG